MTQPNTVNHTQLTPLGLLARARDAFGRRTAIVDGGRRWSYEQLADEVERVASGLRKADVHEGDRVAYLAPNVAELLIAHFAVPLAGAVLVALNTRLSAAEITHILRRSGSKVLVADATLAPLARAAAEPCQDLAVVVIDRPTANVHGSGYGTLLAEAPIGRWAYTVDDERAPISINYTSGTTGDPKGVVYSHRGAYLNALGEIIHSRHDANSVYLWTLPMFHCNGWCTPWAVTGVGGTHVCLPTIDPDEIWRLIDEHGVTHLNAAPTVLGSLLRSDRRHRLHRQVTVTTAGAPPSPATIGELRDTGFEVVHVYGLTEVYGPYTVSEDQPEWRDATADEYGRLLARQGVGMVQTDGVRVVDEAMRDVPRDGVTLGEIVMRGNNVMSGYHDDQAATAAAFAGGWFHSGDLGVRHADGHIELRDRAKDIIVSGGENISTVELENCIMGHEDVLEVAVVAVPDARWGERPKAFVVPRPASSLTADSVTQHVRNNLARFKAPRDVEFRESLPKTSTGKIQKYALREAEWAGHSKRING